MKASKKELFYDYFSAQWESNINHRETQKRIRVVFEDLLKDINLKGKLYLEIGCGLGYFCQKAYLNGAKVYGLDIGKNLIKKCRDKLPECQFFVASSSKLPFNDSFFDVVIATEVIEHVENQNKLIQEALRVLKKDGVFVLTTPNRLYKPLFDLLSLSGARPYHGNEKWFFPNKIKQIIKENKGKIIIERYFNFIYPNEIFNKFEKVELLKYFMINQGYLIKKLQT